MRKSTIYLFNMALAVVILTTLAKRGCVRPALRSDEAGAGRPVRNLHW